MDLHNKYRPSSLSEVVGQDSAVKQLNGFVESGKIPHVICFAGPPGCGKTTLARIMAMQLVNSPMSITEMNLGVRNGIDDIRELQNAASMRPLGGGNSVFVLDESHSLTRQASQGLLKLFEDTPKHAYFFLCTSQPEKIDKAIKTRLTMVSVNTVPEALIYRRLADVCKQEGVEADSDQLEAIARAASGSMRTALVMLGQAIAAGFDAVTLASLVLSEDEKTNIFPICAELMWPKMTWPNIYAILSSIPDEEIEAARWMLLRYAEKVMKQQKDAPRASKVIQAMRAPFFDSKRPGFLANYFLVWSNR